MSPSENKAERHTAIRDLLVATAVASQDAMRKKLARRGFKVTQATLSRDIRELHLLKGPEGYALPKREWSGSGERNDGENELPALAELLASFALRIHQAQNLLVLITVMGSAQPVAAALDYAEIPEIVGTIAGDNTVLLICPDNRQAAALCGRLNVLIG